MVNLYAGHIFPYVLFDKDNFVIFKFASLVSKNAILKDFLLILTDFKGVGVLQGYLWKRFSIFQYGVCLATNDVVADALDAFIL